MRRIRDDRGMATAETAVVLPVLVLLLGFSLWALGVLSAQLRCVEAVRAGARAAARGEPVEEVRSRAGEAAGSGAVVSVERSGPVAVVEVRRRLIPPWPLLARLLPAVTLHAEAAADVEPGEVPS
ncbi:MAG TPA: TadE family type IV pilus minor pilin [Mycobacteriales bacterium]|nr:TadE family type IV pilus minor pilin [Mycobacteriales bacterium]